jgi:hypothetical protein
LKICTVKQKKKKEEEEEEEKKKKKKKKKKKEEKNIFLDGRREDECFCSTWQQACVFVCVCVCVCGLDERCVQGFGGKTCRRRPLGRSRCTWIIKRWIFKK